jgi:predicted GNAT family N-acyltransferase
MTEVRPARHAAEVRAALALRHAVFVLEQRVPLDEEIDEDDDRALHLVAVDDGRVVGTCRLVAEGDTVKLGRLAVASTFRGRGLASRMVAESEARARELGAARIALAAQTEALGLYSRFGYTAYGERFMDAGIEHQMMEKRLG